MRARHKVAAAAGVAALALIGVLVFALLQDPNRYREEIAALLSATAGGHPVDLGGEIDLDWRPSPTLTVRDVRLRTPRLTAHAALARVAAEPEALLALRLRARSVLLDGVTLTLDREAASGSAAPLPDPATLPVDRFEIRDLVLEGVTDEPVRVRRLALSEPERAEGARIEVDLPDPLIQGAARLRTAGARAELSRLELHTPYGTVGGTATIALDRERPRVEADLDASAIAFPTGAGDGATLIPRHALDTAALELLDGSLRVRVGRLSVGKLRVNRVNLPVTLGEGSLSTRASGAFAGGLLTVELAVSAPDRRWRLDLELQDADGGDALGMLGARAVEQGGTLAANVRLVAAGGSTDELLASLEGDLALDAHRLVVRAGTAEIAASDLFAGLLRTLRGESADRIRLECAVARLRVDNGVLHTSQGLGAQARAMNVLGGGRISLPDERVHLAFRPWPREGLGLSASAAVGTVAVTGPLRAPRVGLTDEALWRGSATAGAALATGGLSLIAQGLLERTRGDVPCAQAAGARSAGAGPEAAAGSRVERAGREVGRALRGVGDTLKDVFGSGRGSGATSPARERADP